jgi:glycyl-tRNA synthetase
MVLAALCDSYREEHTEKDGSTDVRVVLGFHPSLAPVKVAYLPLSKKPELMDVTNKLRADLSHYKSQYDDAGSIGKRYRRQDEAGTPLCVTIDFDTLNDKKVTVRHRDTMVQDRVAMDQLDNYIRDAFKNYKRI